MTNKDFSYYLSKFLKDYLVLERNMSVNTIRSYKNTFSQFIDYLINRENYKITSITFSNIKRENVLNYLNYVESDKKNSIRTRNQKLACIKSFYQFCLIENVDNIENIQKVLTIKAKKFPKKVIDYLTEKELKDLLESIDTSSIKGRRNLVVMSLMYDTAARASEIIKLKVEDIHLEEKYVILDGKGKKERIVPIMEQTVDLLKIFLKENNIKNGYILGNNHTYELIRYVISKIKRKYPEKNITPHTMRHTRAIHLLSAGVSLIYIRDLLGHESITTTELYAKVLEKDKFEAIKTASSDSVYDNLEDWNNDQDLLSQLLNL